MAITLYHHPFSRAVSVIWMLKELGLDFEIRFVDIRAGAQREPDFLVVNPMGKLPTLVHDETVLTEVAAIGLFLADRYSLGTLAPAIDDPARATYFRWILYGPSVVEPGCYAHNADWDFKPGSAGWGRWEDMLTTLDRAIGEGPWLLGERFTMADVCLGGTIGYMTRFGMLDKRQNYMDYVERLYARPAYQATMALNAQIINEHDLG